MACKEKTKKELENHARRMNKNDDKLLKEVESQVDSAHEMDDEENKLANISKRMWCF